MKIRVPIFNREITFHRGAARERLANAGLGPQPDPNRQRSLVERFSPVTIRPPRVGQVPQVNVNQGAEGQNTVPPQTTAADFVPLALGNLGDPLAVETIVPPKTPGVGTDNAAPPTAPAITRADCRDTSDPLIGWNPRKINMPLVDRNRLHATSIVDQVAASLAGLPRSDIDWTDDQKASACQQLLSLLAARAALSPQSRAKADAMLQPRLPLLIPSANDSTSKAQKDALADVALGALADPNVPLDLKRATIEPLMLNRAQFSQQIRTAGDDGRAPGVLRQHALPLLTAYKHELERLKAANLQPREWEWDALVIPLIIEAQNAKTEGMDAKLFTQEQLAQLVSQSGQQACQRIGLLDFGAASTLGEGHHAAVLASISPGRPPRVTVLDSFAEPEMSLFSLIDGLPDGSEFVPVHLKTQKAKECVIYAMATAKKIADHRNAVDSLHTKSEPMPNRINSKRLHNSISGPDFLPLAFFKHSTSKNTLFDLAEVGQSSGRHSAKTDAVNKNDRTIFQRWADHKVDRPNLNQPGKVATYSASIEQKRRQFIEQAIDHFKPD
jgi:hypothetical protein